MSEERPTHVFCPLCEGRRFVPVIAETKVGGSGAYRSELHECWLCNATGSVDPRIAGMWIAAGRPMTREEFRNA